MARPLKCKERVLEKGYNNNIVKDFSKVNKANTFDVLLLKGEQNMREPIRLSFIALLPSEKKQRQESY